jgi:hypothetical protein
MESEVTYKEKGDPILLPPHYTRMKIQPITFILENDMEFWRGNIVKYASRAGFKLYEGKTAEESELIDLGKVIRNAELRMNIVKEKIEMDKLNVLLSIATEECPLPSPHSYNHH